MRRSLGDKRREIPPEREQDILQVMANFKDGETRVVRKDGVEEEVVISRIYPTTHFGFRKITVERPLRLNVQASPERIARLEEDRIFKALAQSKKKGAAGSKEQLAGRAKQDAVRGLLRAMAAKLYKDEDKFREALETAARKASVTLPAPVMRSLLLALADPDETAEIVRDGDGNPEPDPALRDTETVPLREDVDTFFEREVRPHVPDAWIDRDRRDEKDDEVGLVGYEINFNRYFYRYKAPRPLEKIDADIRAMEKDIVRMLADVTGTKPEAIVR